MERIRVRFVTNYLKYKVIDSPIAIPTNLGRYGLSEIINHLLELEKAIPFDFIISNQLIRTTLKKFIITNKIITEDVIEIEYMPITSFSNESESNECPSWVGALKSLSNNNHLIAGCYNGQLRSINSNNLTDITTIQAHDLPIRTITSWVHDSKNIIATGSKDNTVKCWLVNPNGQFTCVASLESAVSSIENLESFGNSTIISGDWSGNLFAYDLSKLQLNTETSIPEKVSNKKRKKNTHDEIESISNPVLTASTIPHIFTIHAHAQTISGLQVCSISNRLFTSSWDHSIKQWDLERQECVHTIAGTKVSTSLNLNSKQNLIATSHSDGRIRLWDSRSREGAVSVATLNRAQVTHWISQVKWFDEGSYVLCTSDYNGSITAWDTRSTSVPLSIKEVHDGKGLCLEWKYGSSNIDNDNNNSGNSNGSGSNSNDISTNLESGRTLFSGGSDCCVKSTNLLHSV